MKSQPQKYNLIIADSQLLGALAETGWIVQVNRLIERFQELNVEWNDPVGAAGSGDSPAGETPSSSS